MAGTDVQPYFFRSILKTIATEPHKRFYRCIYSGSRGQINSDVHVVKSVVTTTREHQPLSEGLVTGGVQGHRPRNDRVLDLLKIVVCSRYTRYIYWRWYVADWSSPVTSGIAPYPLRQQHVSVPPRNTADSCSASQTSSRPFNPISLSAAIPFARKSASFQIGSRFRKFLSRKVILAIFSFFILNKKRRGQGFLLETRFLYRFSIIKRDVKTAYRYSKTRI